MSRGLLRQRTFAIAALYDSGPESSIQAVVGSPLVAPDASADWDVALYRPITASSTCRSVAAVDRPTPRRIRHCASVYSSEDPLLPDWSGSAVSWLGFGDHALVNYDRVPSPGPHIQLQCCTGLRTMSTILP